MRYLHLISSILFLVTSLTFSGGVDCQERAHFTSTQIPGELPKPDLPKRFTGRWTVKLAGTDKIMRECTLVDGQLQGVQKFWHRNGQLASEGSYVSGKQDGRHAIWDEKGALISEGWWREGEQHGPVREWHNGIATLDGNYSNNQKHGRWIVHDWNGPLIADGIYDMGEPVTGTFIIPEGKGWHLDRYRDRKRIEKGTQQ